MSEQKMMRIRITVYYVVFWLVWCLMEFFVNPLVSNSFFVWPAEINKSILKIMIWTVPAALFIHRYRNQVLISLRGMFVNRVNWLKYLPLFLLFVVYNLAADLILCGKVAVNHHFVPATLISFLIVGITEEMVFRGWILNACLKIMKPKFAVLLNAVLFLAIHFPVWIYKGILLTNILNAGFLCILVLGVIFCLTFIKSKNLLVPIALHMLWDLLEFIMFGG